MRRHVTLRLAAQPADRLVRFVAVFGLASLLVAAASLTARAAGADVTHIQVGRDSAEPAPTSRITAAVRFDATGRHHSTNRQPGCRPERRTR